MDERDYKAMNKDNTLKKVSLKELEKFKKESLQNPHFKPKSFKPTQKTMMAHALDFAKWKQTTPYVWRSNRWYNYITNKKISELNIYKEFLATL